MTHRISAPDLITKKRRGEKITMMTCYDYPSARILDECGLDILFIGDTLGMVVLGYDSTVPVTMDEMLHHTRAVSRGTTRAHVLADLPFMSYQIGPEDAIRNACRLLQEGGVQSVKLEGGQSVAPTVRRMVDAGIPVMGHIGLTPQSINQLGGHKVQGKSSSSAYTLYEDAVALEEAGAYAIVLECVPAQLAEIISERILIPTIGIGSGPMCDGQVQVFHDVFGLYPDFLPRHAKRYAVLADFIADGARRLVSEVQSGAFPGESQTVFMKDFDACDLQRLVDESSNRA